MVSYEEWQALFALEAGFPEIWALPETTMPAHAYQHTRTKKCHEITYPTVNPVTLFIRRRRHELGFSAPISPSKAPIRVNTPHNSMDIEVHSQTINGETDRCSDKSSAHRGRYD